MIISGLMIMLATFFIQKIFQKTHHQLFLLGLFGVGILGVGIFPGKYCSMAYDICH